MPNLLRRPPVVAVVAVIAAVGVLSFTAPSVSARSGPSNAVVVAFWKAILRMVPFAGNGAWVDAYDWSPTVNRGPAPFGPTDVDALADRGVQVLYIQTARANLPDDVLDVPTLRTLIDRAHARRMRVVGWYLPTFADMVTDLRRFGAMRSVGVDAIAVDIEDTSTPLADRNARLVVESVLLRWWLPDVGLGAVVLPPVVTDTINTKYWPEFPWTRIAGLYDVWMPMAYWTNRTADSGYRDAYRYTAENIDRTRANLGRPNAVISVVGGIADKSTLTDMAGFVAAAKERKVIGGSMYDARTMGPDLWAPMTAFRL